MSQPNQNCERQKWRRLAAGGAVFGALIIATVSHALGSRTSSVPRPPGALQQLRESVEPHPPLYPPCTMTIPIVG